MDTTKATGGNVEISDPNNVPETVVSGPFNVTKMGASVVFTYTVVRPDPTAVFAGEVNPPYKGIVVARIAMPTLMAEELMRVLERTFARTEEGSGRMQ
jgi:hypothetical protein